MSIAAKRIEKMAVASLFIYFIVCKSNLYGCAIYKCADAYGRI